MFIFPVQLTLCYMIPSALLLSSSFRLDWFFYSTLIEGGLSAFEIRLQNYDKRITDQLD